MAAASKVKSAEGAPEVRTGDQIVYQCITYDKNGPHIVAAGFKPADAEAPDEPFDFKKTVVDMEDARNAALAKLDALDRLVLGLE